MHPVSQRCSSVAYAQYAPLLAPGASTSAVLRRGYETGSKTVRFEFGDAALMLTDGANLKMNMTETPHAGRI